MASDKSIPADIAIDLKKREVRIRWNDGHLSCLPLDTLRKNCPCAQCNELRSQKNDDPLRILKADQANASGDLMPGKPVEEVGRYGLQFFWADGHRTGIYTYQFLRELDTTD
jgi:DUF971 family protein